jgi:hypothetical protein
VKALATAALAALVLAPVQSPAALPRVRAVIVAATSGAKLAEATGAPRPIGATIGDGREGFLAASRNGVVRVRADGSADPSFADANGEVDALVLTAGVLVTAGPTGLQFIDPRTGMSVHPPVPLAPAGTKVFVGAIAASGPLVFVVGSTQRGQNGSSQLAFGADVRSGLRTAFHPIVRNGIATGVAAAGSVVYLAGAFKHVGGAPRCNLAAVTAATGALRSWRSETCLPESPFAMTATRNTLFVGRLHGFLAVRADNGKRLSWSRRVSQALSAAGVASLALSGHTLYLGTVGDAGPVTIGGARRAGYLALDTRNGKLLPWQVRVARFQNGQVLAASGARVLAAGSFRG